MPMFFNRSLPDRLPASQPQFNWRGERVDNLSDEDGWLSNQAQSLWSGWSTLFDRDSDFHTGRQPDHFTPPSWQQETHERRFQGPDTDEPADNEFTVSGSVSSFGSSSSVDSSLSGYHYFSVEPGTHFRAEVERLEADLDPSFWVFEGQLTEDDFDGDYFDWADPRQIAYADDEIPYDDGPFGDPRAEFVAPESGQFTIVVTNFASGPDDGGDGRFDYRLDVVEIEASGVEDPLPPEVFDMA